MIISFINFLINLFRKLAAEHSPKNAKNGIFCYSKVEEQENEVG